MEDDEVIGNFIAITGANPDVAKHLLESSNYDMDSAINLFYDMNNGQTGNDSPRVQAEESDNHPAAVTPVNEDIPPEVLAALAEDDPNMPMDDDDVRAPIPYRQETLVEQPSWRTLAPSIRSTIRNPTPTASGLATTTSAILNTSPPEVEVPEEDEDDASALDRLYATPSYAYKGPWESACETAQLDGRWILLNVINETFDSQRYNSEVWRDSSVREWITDSFLLFQVKNTSPEGSRLLSTYPSKQIPCVHFIDYRTREKLRTVDGVMDPSDFVQRIHDFIVVQAERVAMEEEEMAACRAAEVSRADSRNSSDMEIESNEVVEESVPVAAKDPEPSLEEFAARSAPYELASASAAGAVRVQLRYPDGQREVLIIRDDTPLARLYDLCTVKYCAHAKDDSIIPFELTTFGGTVSKDLHTTVRDAKVAGAAVTMKLS